MAEISNGFANAGENPRPSKVAIEHELEANGRETSSSNPSTCPEELYPTIKSMCEDLFSHRVQRNLAYEQIMKEIENSQKVYCEENSEGFEITEQLDHMLHVQEEVRRKGRHVAHRALDLKKIEEHTEKKIMLEKDKSNAFNEDTKNLCSWYLGRQSNIERYRRETEEYARQLAIQKDVKAKAVNCELQRRKDASEGRDRIKNQRRDDMQKSTVDKNSRRDDLRQKFDQFVSSNQRGQELRMYQEKLKKVHHQFVQRSTEVQAAKLKEGGDSVFLNNSMQRVETAISHANKEADCKDEIQKIAEACRRITEEHDKLVVIQEDAGVEEETLVEVKLLRVEKSLKGASEKKVLTQELNNLQNRLKQLELKGGHLITSNELQQREEELLAEIAKSKDNNQVIAEEVDIFDSLVHYAVEKIDENAKELKEKVTELEGILCNHTSQKIELKKMSKLKDEQMEQVLVKKHRLSQIERSILDLQGSIKSMEKEEERKKRGHIEESEKSRFQLRKVIKELENDRKQLNAELTDLFTEASNCQGELRKLKEAKMDFKQVSLSHAEHIRTKLVEVNDLRTKVEAAEQEYKKWFEKFEESERLFEALSDKVSNVMTPQKDAVLKDSDETVALEASFIDKKRMLSQTETTEQERKLRLAKNETELDEMTSRLKQQLDILDEEKRKNAERVQVVDQELARHNESTLLYKEEHEQVLYAYDSAADKCLQVREKYATVKKNKIKLLNMCDMTEKVATETEVKDNGAMESKRVDLDIFKNKYEVMVQRQNEQLDKLRRQLAAFDAKISEFKEKRMVEKKSISSGLSSGPKPILKPPTIDVVDATLKKSVSFGESPDNLQILHSDSSLEMGSGFKSLKRKLLPPLQEKPVIKGKSCRISSNGKTL